MIKKRFALLSALGLLFFACKQSPIFYEISLEVEPIEPRVKGSPVNIALLGDSLYTASRFSGVVYRYKGSEWTALPQSPGDIVELAATDGALYALTGTPGSLELKRLPKGSQTWTSIGTTSYNAQSIYGAGEYLFVGSMKDISSGGLDCSILYIKDDESVLTSLISGVGLLKGAVYYGTTYYLAASGNGILSTANPSSTSVTPVYVSGSGYNSIVGIIKVGNKIVGVSRNGYILYGDTGGFTAVKAAGIDSFTGALAVWEVDGTHLLLLGIQGGTNSTVHGYREMLLDGDGSLNTSAMALRRPGENAVSSVKDYDNERNGYEQYVVTIGKHPLSSIMQAPDETLFATTAKDGLWSYRERNGKPVWNAED